MKLQPIEILAWTVCIGIIVLCPGAWIFKSYMEAKVYTKVTGVKVSTWDAMWVELRVQTGPGTQEK